MNEMPVLETERILIRPFAIEDLAEVYQLLDVELSEAKLGTDKLKGPAERTEWLEWTVLNYSQLAKLNQPPYGDRAIVLKSTGQLIGACGYVPCLNAFEQLPSFVPGSESQGTTHNSTEFGLFYAISPAYQHHGYATEAAQGLIDYALQHLGLRRIIATTTYDNIASMGVMKKLGMRLEKNPLPEPPWLQVVGIIESR